MVVLIKLGCTGHVELFRCVFLDFDNFWIFLDVHCSPMNSSTLGSEVWLHVAGAEALSFDEFPIPSGEHEVVRRGQNWKLQAVC